MIRRFILLCPFLAGLALTRAVEPSSLEERLRALESKVSALESENAELRRAVGAPKSAASHNGAGADSATSADRVAPVGKETRLVIGGYTQGQAEFGGAADARYAGTSDRFYFRRARLNVAGTFAEHFEFKVEGEFGAGTITPTNGIRAAMNDTFLAWTRYPEAVVRIGQLKPAFSAELLGTEFKGPVMERSLGAERIGDGRQVGVEVAGENSTHRLGYQIFVGNGNGANSSANDNNKFLQTARAYAVAFDSPAAGKLTLGADALHSVDTALSKPGAGFDSVPGGAIDNLFTGTRDAWGLDAAWHAGLFDVSTELLRAHYRPVNAIPVRSFDAESWQITAAYFLVPHYFQAALRREHFDPNTAHAGDSTENWLAGLTYYIKGDDLRLMVDYLFGHAAGQTTDQGRLLTRFQIVY